MLQTNDTSLSPEPDRASWRAWLLRVLPGLGTALVLAAVIYFFAANRQRIPPFVRLLLVETGLVLSVSAFLALRRRAPHAADAALTAAGLFMGVFWAVFGQIYQTGADAWQLFALWAACIAPWLPIRPATALWALWVTTLNIALALWSRQAGMENGLGSRLSTPLSLALTVNILLWAACVGAARLRPLLRRRAELFGSIVLPFVLAYATAPVCTALLGYAASYPEPVSWPRALTGMAGLAVVLAYAVRTGRPFPFFLLALCGYPLLNSALFRIEDRGGVGGSLFWYATGNVLYTLTAVRGLFRLRRPPVAAAPDDPTDDRRTNSPGDAAPQSARGESVLSHLLGGLGGGLSALFVTALAAYVLYKADALHATGMLATALLFMGTGLAAARRTGSFALILSLILPLAGFAFLTVGLADRFNFREAAAGVALATAVLYPFHRHAGWRFVSVLSALLLLRMAFSPDFDIFSSGGGTRHGLAFEDALTLLCALPILPLAWGKRPCAALRPALYAALLSTALALPLWSPLHRPTPAYNGMDSLPVFSPGLQPFTPFAALCGLALLLLLFHEGRRRLTAIRGGAAALGLLALPLLAPAEAVFALVLLLEGHARALRALEILGFVLLGVFLAGYYTLLAVPLLLKAFFIGIPGLVLLVGTAFVPAKARSKKYSGRCRPTRSIPRNGAAAALLLLVTLGAFQYAIHARESLLEKGDILLLALAPADPRSLMQGDYMALSYALENELDAGDFPLRGYAILKPDERGAARLVEVRAKRGAPSPELYAVPYHRETWKIVLGLPHSFLFEEGQAERYAAAAYGIFRCAPDGDCLLTGLADENGRNLDTEKQGDDERRTK